MAGRRLKNYDAAIMDADGGTHHYIFEATSLRRARAQARRWVERSYPGAVLLEIRPKDDRVKGRRLLVVAGATCATAGPSIAIVMIVALRWENAL
jgi:hypothetical protein